MTVLELAHGITRADTTERRDRRQRFLDELLTGVPIQPVTEGGAGSNGTAALHRFMIPSSNQVCLIHFGGYMPSALQAVISSDSLVVMSAALSSMVFL